MARYRVGRPTLVQPIGRGSRQSAKSRVRTPQGDFLLKRRDPRKSVPEVVAFVHRFQLHLGAAGVPLPRLVPAADGATAVTGGLGMYELFEWVDGAHWRPSLDAAAEVGVIVGEALRASRAFEPGPGAPVISPHRSSALRQGVDIVLRRAPRTDRDTDRAALAGACEALLACAARAADAADAAGIAGAPRLCIHGDLHPGNVMFDGERVRALLDFDGARLDWRACELASAALHFANAALAGRPPAEWRPELSLPRAGALVTGVQHGLGEPLTPQERLALPWLMIEGCVLESIVPIARTGRFAQLRADAFLPFIASKVRWIEDNAAAISALGA
jgi:Ser/Thr protein kinase RdoA (MazF antagonist)